MDILERIERYLEEEVASGGAAMGGDSSGLGTPSPGTTTSKVAKYQKSSSIMTGGKSKKKKKPRSERVLGETEMKRLKKDKDKHRYASDEVDHDDSEEQAQGGQKRVKSGSQNMTTGIGWRLRGS
jgi:hypothetical protein